MATPKAAGVRVLHRATDGEADTASSDEAPLSEQELIQQLRQANDSLQERLKQAKATSAAERKRLGDDLKIEKAGRQRAEELLVRQAKELEACAAAKARLEEAFSRSMSELRYTRLEHQQAEQTIQQLLRELMQLRDIVSRQQQAQAAQQQLSGGGAGALGGAPGALRALATANGLQGAAAAGGAADGGSPLSKARSKGKLIGELQQLRAAMAEAESKLGALEAEKERAEESQEMISRQTAKLLDDRAALLADISTKDEAVRGLQAGLDHLTHQLELALADRRLLLQQLTSAAGGEGGAPDMAALTAALGGAGFSQDLDELPEGALGELPGAEPGEGEEGPQGQHLLPHEAGEQQQQHDAQHVAEAAQ